MGTTLTGTTPQDTYDSLIKVTDNGPISGTAKYLSDGLGNDSALALSTARVFIGKTTNNNTFNSRLQVVSDNTTAGGVLVDHFQNDATGAFLFLAKSRSNVVGTSTIVQNNDTLGQIDFNGANGSAWSLGATIAAQVDGTAGATNDMPARLIFSTSADGSATPTERMRITAAGNVGIGTSAPANKLVVKSGGYGAVASFLDAADNGFVFKADGFNGFNAIDQSQQLIMNFGGAEKYRFNTDGTLQVGSGIVFPSTQVASAGANTLDDYEEGTWTMGVSFGGAAVGVTYAANTGTYTKIGRQVTVNGILSLTSKGSSTGSARITGLPFTISNSGGTYSSASLRLDSITFTNQFQAYGLVNTTSIVFEEITVLGLVSNISNTDFADTSAIIISFTYFV